MIGQVVLKKDLVPVGGWVPIGGKGSGFFYAHVGEGETDFADRICRPLALASGDKAYVLPVWSSLQHDIEAKDGYVWLAWQSTEKRRPNVMSAGDPTYFVMLHPDGRIEELCNAAGGVIGGKPYYIRSVSLGKKDGDREVFGWGGMEGPAVKEIRDITFSHGAPVYLAQMDGEFWVGSTQAVIRHPGKILYQGKDGIEGPFSDNHTTVRYMGPQLITQADGSVVWVAMPSNRNKPSAVYQDGKVIYRGPFIAFHRRPKDKVLTIIGRKGSGNGRTIQEIGR
jgi:hypothetical protein